MPKLSLGEIARPTSFLALGLIAVLMVMILPVPSFIMDIGLTASFAFAILIFTTTIFIEKPLDFSSFPSVLLASLLLRLSLNVASTKLIIGQGHTGTDAAGGVIEGFAMFIMGGNLFLGLVVFSVLIIVNFMVITKGAGRMAEVGARFALDAMPGKQLAIDSDLAVGAIDHNEAKRRRQSEQEEAAFLGSLDGVSKFVKGDAVAGLLITFLNLVAGIAFGLSVHGLSFEQALSNYSILTVGDGLVSQIPAVIISVSAALLLSKGREEGAIDLALVAQLGANAATLYIVGGILGIFALFPGLPFVPFMVAALGFMGLAWVQQKSQSDKKLQEVSANIHEEKPKPKTIGDSIICDEIHVDVATNLVKLILQGETGFEKRVDRIRRYIAEEYGFVLPSIRVTDSPLLNDNEYRVLIQGVPIVKDKVRPGRIMALLEADQFAHLQGENVKEPVYGAAARWVSADARAELVASEIPTIEPVEVLATHLLEIIQSNFSKIFTRMTLRETLDAFIEVSDAEKSRANKRFMDEYIPEKVSMEILQSTMRILLEERVSIRNITLIVETIAEAKGSGLSCEQIAELVRRRLSFQIISKLSDSDGKLPIIQLSADWEKQFSDHETNNSTALPDIALPPDVFNQLLQAVQLKLNESAMKGISASIATSSRRRRFLRTVLNAKGIRNAVLAYEEIGTQAKPYIVGVA